MLPRLDFGECIGPLSSNVVVSRFHRSNPHRSFSVAGPAPLQILLCRRSCFVDDPSPLSDPSPSSDASPSQSEFSAVQHRSVYRLAFLVLRAFSSTVMSSISSPHSFSQRFGILSFDCKVEPKRDVDAEWIEVSIDKAKALAERLVKLEHLSISSCKLVEEIYVHDEIMSHIAHVHDEIMSHIPHIRKSSHVEMVPIFPNLETLVISNMDNFNYGAYLADGSEYRGLYGPDVNLNKLKDFHRRRLQVLVEAGPDLLAFETIPNKLEAQAIVELLEEINVEIPSWICFTSVDGENAPSGERFRDCLELTKKAIVVYTIF
ncbi:putative disease resistance protein [Trifolium repens]|nr:putative disease resistance protein [Trifolium repens]